MKAIYSRLLVLLLTGAVGVAYAGTPVHEMTCADYLGSNTDSKASSTNADSESKKSAAYQVGLKLGISVRQASMANWVQGYLVGYAAATQGKNANTLDIDSLRSRLRIHCSSHQLQTMRQAAEAFRPL